MFIVILKELEVRVTTIRNSGASVFFSDFRKASWRNFSETIYCLTTSGYLGPLPGSACDATNRRIGAFMYSAFKGNPKRSHAINSPGVRSLGVRTHNRVKIINPSKSVKPVMAKLQNLFGAVVIIDIFHMTLKFSLLPPT